MSSLLPLWAARSLADSLWFRIIFMIQCYTQTMDARFLNGIEPPAFVKTASFAEGGDADRLPESAFALVVLDKTAASRLLPIHDKPHTWVSGQYLAQHWPGLPKTAAAMAARNVCEAANFFNVDVPESLKKVAALHQTAGRLYQKNPYDLPIGYSEQQGSTKVATYNMEGELFPISNRSELLEAESWFDRNHTKLAYVHRYRMAGFIAQQRANLIDPNEKTAGYESRAVSDLMRYARPNPQVDTELYKRASHCTDRASFEGYVKLAHNVGALFTYGPAAAIDAIHTLDTQSGLTRGYGIYFNDPIKTAMTFESFAHDPGSTDHVGIADRVIRVDEVWGPPLTVREIARSCEDGRVAKVMSQSFAETLKKNPEAVLASLPEDLRKTVLEQIRPNRV